MKNRNICDSCQMEVTSTVPLKNGKKICPHCYVRMVRSVDMNAAYMVLAEKKGMISEGHATRMSTLKLFLEDIENMEFVDDIHKKEDFLHNLATAILQGKAIDFIPPIPEANENENFYEDEEIPCPKEIYENLSRFVIGQDKAKRKLSVAIYGHAQKIVNKSDIPKSNLLLVGATGTGKTYMLSVLASFLDLPFICVNATSFTEAGYRGKDVEEIIQSLYIAADKDVEKTERGIVFIDEIDKIAINGHSISAGPDVGGTGVQQSLLKLMEGCEVEVGDTGGMAGALMHLSNRKTIIDTSNILFVCGGAFSGIEDIIHRRKNGTSSIGFGSIVSNEVKSNIKDVTVEDIIKYGMIPEFIGRLPVIVTYEAVTLELLKRILIEPENSIISQYQELFSYDNIELSFEDEAIEEIAKIAIEKETGTRALKSVLEDVLSDLMFDLPGTGISNVIITADYVKGIKNPILQEARYCG